MTECGGHGGAVAGAHSGAGGAGGAPARGAREGDAGRRVEPQRLPGGLNSSLRSSMPAQCL